MFVRLLAVRLSTVLLLATVCVATLASPTQAAESLQLVVRDSYLPGVPVLVRVEAVDSKGNLYVSETLEGSRIQRFVPKGMTSGE